MYNNGLADLKDYLKLNFLFKETYIYETEFNSSCKKFDQNVSLTNSLYNVLVKTGSFILLFP